MIQRYVTVAALCISVMAIQPGASAIPVGGSTSAVSRSTEGTIGNDDSAWWGAGAEPPGGILPGHSLHPGRDEYNPSISGDGRFVAFVSVATNLVPGDTNAAKDAFVRDTHAQTTTRISVSSSGVEGNGDSLNVRLSGDGRFAVFSSAASNLVTDDNNGVADIFLHDLSQGTTSRIVPPEGIPTTTTTTVKRKGKPSTTTTTSEVHGYASNPEISNDGSKVVFRWTKIYPDSKSEYSWLYLWDSTDDSMQKIDSYPDGTLFRDVMAPRISGDGRYLFFNDQEYQDGVLEPIIFRRDNSNGTIKRVSEWPDGERLRGWSASVSADGNLIAFGSGLGSLTVYLKDMTTGRLRRAPQMNLGGEEIDPFISGDGRYVAFATSEPQAVEDTNVCIHGSFIIESCWDVYLWDTASVLSGYPGSSFLVSRSSSGKVGDSESWAPALSGDGSSIAFVSQSTNLDPDDVNGRIDVFLRRQG